MLKAKDVMIINVITVSPRDSVQKAIEKLVGNKVSSLIVKDDNEDSVGIVTEYDLILAVSTVGRGLDVEDIMKKDYVRIKEDTSLEDVANIFLEKRVKVLPVLDNQCKLTGIVSRRDILEKLYACA